MAMLRRSWSGSRRLGTGFTAVTNVIFSFTRMNTQTRTLTLHETAIRRGRLNEDGNAEAILERKQKAGNWLYSSDKCDILLHENEYTDSHADATRNRHQARTLERGWQC